MVTTVFEGMNRGASTARRAPQKPYSLKLGIEYWDWLEPKTAEFFSLTRSFLICCFDHSFIFLIWGFYSPLFSSSFSFFSLLSNLFSIHSYLFLLYLSFFLSFQQLFSITINFILFLKSPHLTFLSFSYPIFKFCFHSVVPSPLHKLLSFMNLQIDN